jgi:hypothetical protein
MTTPVPKPEVESEPTPVIDETPISDEALAVADELELERLLQEEASQTEVDAAEEEVEPEEEEGGGEVAEFITADFLNSPITFDLDQDQESDTPVVRFAEDIFPTVPGRGSGRGDKNRGKKKGKGGKGGAEYRPKGGRRFANGR